MPAAAKKASTAKVLDEAADAADRASTKVERLAHQLASRQLDAARRYQASCDEYASVLERYVAGDTRFSDVGKRAVGLYASEAVHGLQDLVDLSGDCARWAWSLVGVEVKPAPVEG